MSRYIPYIVLLFLLATPVAGQVRVDKYTIPVDGKSQALAGELVFPEIKSSNKLIDSLINNHLKNEVTYDDFGDIPVQEAVRKWTSEGASYLNFEVTYNANGLLSLFIEAEWCAAYCSSWQQFFNFSTTTGKPLRISDVIKDEQTFGKMVLSDRTMEYSKLKNEIENLAKGPDTELEKEDIDIILEQYNYCEDRFSMEQFSLYPDRLVIQEQCFMPNYLKDFTPVIELTFPYDSIRQLLKLNL